MLYTSEKEYLFQVTFAFAGVVWTEIDSCKITFFIFKSYVDFYFLTSKWKIF